MRANTLMVCVLTAAGAVAAEYPEKAEDSQAIRSQQYRQMDAYLDKQVEQAEARRTGYWSKLDFASPAAYDRSAQVYRDDWSRYLGVPERAAAPWTHRRVKLADNLDNQDMTRIAAPSDKDRARIEEYKAIRAFLLEGA